MNTRNLRSTETGRKHRHDAGAQTGPRVPQKIPGREDDIGRGARFADSNRGRIWYCYAWKSWLDFDGRRWVQDAGDRVKELANAEMRMMLTQEVSA